VLRFHARDGPNRMKPEHLSAIKGEDGAWDLGDDHSKATPRPLQGRCSMSTMA